ncbi:MAG: pyridoxal-phosphate dependent enzyme [Candidatus Hodarchaeota archaeon]
MNYELLKEKINSLADFAGFYSTGLNSMWKFFDFLPVLNPRSIISLNEGATPVVRGENLGSSLGFQDIHLKIEIGNPTGSFKDRQVSVGISKAMELKKKGVMTVSSGNVGAAVAAYAARAKVPALVLVHEMSPLNKTLQIQAYGARLARVSSNSTGDILEAIKPHCKKNDFMNLMTASPVNPYINHGAKTIAYEITLESLINPQVPFPDVIICPAGGGGLLAFVYQGFLDLVELGVLERIPRFIAVQPSGCAPLAEAILKNLPVEHLFAYPWKDIDTIASALADDVPLDARLAIPAIKKSRGTACIVNDEDILKGEKVLASKEGIFTEPSSAITVAALEHVKNSGVVDTSEKIFLLITGSGFKDMESCKKITEKQETYPLTHDWNKEFQKLL